MKRLGSVKSRKVSTQSLRSECSDGEHSGEADSGGMMSDENTESPDHPDTEEQDYCKYMPWIKVSCMTSGADPGGLDIPLLAHDAGSHKR